MYTICQIERVKFEFSGNKFLIENSFYITVDTLKTYIFDFPNSNLKSKARDSKFIKCIYYSI